MSRPTVSVVVVSRDRPRWLARCLTALGQLDYPNFEIVVAADATGLEAVRAHALAAHVKTVACDVANISVARNAGIALAAGEIVAFIDDDAVPEPMWLHFHVAAQTETGAVASVGYVRGRNGISFQSRAASIDSCGETFVAPSPDTAATKPELPEGRALKLVGTNMAIRRDVLVALGGFDPAYRFYLDDTDLSWRLGQAGYRATVAPLAEVHHGFAESPRRAPNRVPKRLYDIGHSTAIFLARHGGADRDGVQKRMVDREQARMTGHMVRGYCEPRDVGAMLRDLMAGWRDGAVVSQETPVITYGNPIKFMRFPSLKPDHIVTVARLADRRAAIAAATAQAQNGRRASLFSFSLTPVRHHVRYMPGGIWLQTGGVFGRSTRTGPRYRWCSFTRRVKEEITRVEKQRGIVENTTRVG